MTGTRAETRRRGAAAAWTSGLTVFAAVMLITSGVFQMLEGIAALLRGAFIVVTQNYAFQVDAAVWGWLHLLLGAAIVALGVALLRGAAFARVVAMALAVASAVVHFLFIPYQPVWSVIVIALDIAVVWALAGYEPETREPRRVNRDA